MGMIKGKKKNKKGGKDYSHRREEGKQQKIQNKKDKYEVQTLRC